jgi:hypothetical protein
MLEALKTKYHEVPVYGAATGPELEMPLVVTVSPEGSYTILLGVKGMLCVLSSGNGWTKLVE